jgi:large subunit ribosomal protein L32
MRRAHDSISFNADVEVCDNCSALKLRHRVCEDCGYYKGKQIIEPAN